MYFEVKFQKVNQNPIQEGKCHAQSPSHLVATLLRHGYHAISYHEVPENDGDIVDIQVGKGDSNEIEQSREICEEAV